MTKIAQIIDAHHHLWDLSHCHYPWLMEHGVRRFFGDPTSIQKNYLLSDFMADHGDLPIVKSVHIQVGVQEEDAVKETNWLQSIADKYGFPNAIIAFADLTKSDFETILARHSQANHFRGVRQIIGRSAEEDAKTGTSALLSHPTFAENLQLLGKQNLSFDLQLTPPLMKDAAQLFLSHQNTPLALCHAGSLSDFSVEGINQWQMGLKSFSNHENILCKISGYGMFDHSWTTDTIRDYVLRTIDIFGPNRIAFGSNFPVDKLNASYANVIGAYLTITAGFSESERKAMFHDNAEHFYRI